MSDNATPPRGGQQPAQPPDTNTAIGAGAAIGGQAGTQTYANPPSGLPDQQMLQWFLDQSNAIDAQMPALETDYDNAGIEYDNLQAKYQDAAAVPDTVAMQTLGPLIAQARAKMALAQRRVEQARAAQNRYLTQYQQTADRVAKAQAQQAPISPADQAQLDQRTQEFQAQIANNNAQIALGQARLAQEQHQFDAQNSPERIAADTAMKQAQARADRANAAYTQAKAATVAAESAAGVANTNAQTANTNANANLTNAQVAAGLPGSEAQKNQAAANASNSEVAVNQQKLAQATQGDAAYLHNQLTQWIAAAPDDREAARREAAAQADWDAFNSGGSALQWQGQINQAAGTLADNMARAGMLTSGAGLDPSGAISKALAGVGIQWQDTTRGGTPLPQWAQQIGLNLRMPTYPLGDRGASAPWAQNLAQGVASGQPAVVNGDGMSDAQIQALLHGTGGPQQHSNPFAGATNSVNTGPTSADSFAFSPAVQKPAGVGAN